VIDQASGRITPTPLPHTATMAASAALQPITHLQVKLLTEKAKAPTRGSAFAAGYDLYSSEDTVVPARGKAMVETGISIAVPDGTCTCASFVELSFLTPIDGRVAPRSGLAAKHSIDTGAGVIDYDYRGPVKVILFNYSEVDFKIAEGDRIAQLVLERIVTPDVVVVEALSETVRGAGGFGSTGGFSVGGPLPAV
jgi:dUTP pyrophosphatase